MNIKKLISVIISLVMMVLSMIPGLSDIIKVDTISNAQWLADINYAFGQTAAENDTENAIETAFEWGIIDSKDIDPAAAVTFEFAAETLVNAAKLEFTGSKTDTAVEYGIIALNSRGKFPSGKISAAAAAEALAAAKAVWANKSFDNVIDEYDYVEGVVEVAADDYTIDGNVVTLPADAAVLEEGDVFVLPQTAENPVGAAFEVVSLDESDDELVAVTAPVDIEDVIGNINFEGSVVPDISFAEDGAEADVASYAEDLIDNAKSSVKDKISNFLTNPEVSFELGGINFDLKGNKNEILIAASGVIPGTDGIRFYKTYAFTNINVSAKFDANFLQAKIKEAYVLINYDLDEMTCFDGSYAASVAPKDLGSDADALSFLDKVKNNMFTLQKGGAQQIEVFDISIPIGATSIAVDLTLSVQVDVYGKISLSLTTSESKGFEIIDNKARIINDEVVIDRQIDVAGNFKVLAGLNLGVSCFGVSIIDVGFSIGLGANVTTVVFNNGISSAFEGLGIDTAIEATAGLDDADALEYCADIFVYGLMTVSVGENSIIKKIGLSKTWVIWDSSNKVIADYHIENGSLVDVCTAA